MCVRLWPQRRRSWNSGSQHCPLTSGRGETVTWGEWANKSTDCPVVDEVSYQVKIWAQDLDRLRGHQRRSQPAQLGLGLKRTYSAPDEFAEDGMGFYTKTYRFGRKVDKRTMRLID